LSEADVGTSHACAFRNLRVWEALPSKTWESTRAKLVQAK
jgi:hypothetical protein